MTNRKQSKRQFIQHIPDISTVYYDISGIPHPHHHYDISCVPLPRAYDISCVPRSYDISYIPPLYHYDISTIKHKCKK